MRAICNKCSMNEPSDEHGAERDDVVDAVLTASRVLVAIAARSLADVAEEVTLTQYRSLVVLASRGPQSVAALAEELAVTPSTASRLCDRLVRKGLVRRREDRQDRRAVRLALTPAGRGLVDAVTERRRTELASLLDGIPATTQRSMARALARLAEAAGEVPEQEWSTGWDL
jgi:DNA-binding MarR family transcriptional regulator